MATEEPKLPLVCALGLVSVMVLSALAAGKNSITESASARAILKNVLTTFIWFNLKVFFASGML
jgi:hypothetical protein